MLERRYARKFPSFARSKRAKISTNKVCIIFIDVILFQNEDRVDILKIVSRIRLYR